MTKFNTGILYSPLLSNSIFRYFYHLLNKNLIFPGKYVDDFQLLSDSPSWNN